MLIKEKIEQTTFTPSEQQVIRFLTENAEQLQDFSIRAAAKQCYTYPSTLVRVAKKLGFSGWSALKQAYLAEVRYMNTNFKQVDANFPFQHTDTFMTIASKLSVLAQETIEDTLTLLQHDDLRKAVCMLEKASEVKVFARNHNNIIAQEFALRMNRIGHYTSVCKLDGEQLFEAANARQNSCALFITYSGESLHLEKTATILRQKGVPILLITSIGNNSLSAHADCLLYITTREKLYSKISDFSVMTSINHLLNTLYSCIFAQNYQKNYEHLLNVSLTADGRKSNVEIIKEQD
jgi:DNA-binding MurR/RpiR family transcriptional regulator